MAALRVRAAAVAEPLPETPDLSIIIPVLNEAETLDNSLSWLFAQPWLDTRCEVIVCDGGSRDATLASASHYPCRIVHSHRGRAAQMNAASAIASGRLLLFLHADSRLAADFEPATLPTAGWGFFRLCLDDDALIYRVIEKAINWRTRITRIAGGDQGLFFARSLFRKIDGYPGIPLMEDIAICKQARKISRPVIIDSPLASSVRRWRKQGVLKTVLLMWWLRFAYWLGVDPEHLRRIYYPGHGTRAND